ncbi:FecR family protein [Hyphococcus lacteus]|uniref:FecR domain-containing protein n=1 Tax=Hyphococcus lacteus TaxID=3143536 RepID=A0ABV3Z7I3_9PROT
MNDKNIVELPDNDVIEKEAALWIMRADDVALTPDMRAELAAWMKRSVRHRHAFERMAAMWGMADLLEDYNRIDPIESPLWFASPMRSVVLTGAIAASLVLFVGAVLFKVGPWTPSIQEETFRTAIGEQRTVPLADGSVMILNTDTKASIEIGRKLRVVKLKKGEAHFDVAKEKNRPFQVYAEQRLVQAVGTAFTVRLRERDVEVTVAEGVVELFTQDMPTSGTAEIKAPSEWRSLTALSANESAVFDEGVASRAKLDKSALKKKLMWRDGFLAFSGEPLADVVAEMSRYTEYEIVISDPELRSLPIAGSYEAGNIKGMFDSLERAFGIKAERNANGGVVLSRGA